MVQWRYLCHILQCLYNIVQYLCNIVRYLCSIVQCLCNGMQYLCKNCTLTMGWWRPFSDGRGGNCITWPPVSDEMDHRPNYVQTLVCATMLSLCGPHCAYWNIGHNKQQYKQTASWQRSKQLEPSKHITRNQTNSHPSKQTKIEILNKRKTK